jgi:hypothetical protein
VMTNSPVKAARHAVWSVVQPEDGAEDWVG